MKGVILAGGNGSRLMPLTKAVNKHLLPVGPYPMIYWSIMKLEEAGIKDILLISQKEHMPQFYKLLGNGEELGVTITYQVQPAASGISDGLSYAKRFTKKESFILLLGDNIFEDSLKPYTERFEQQGKGAKVLLKEVDNRNASGLLRLMRKTSGFVPSSKSPKSHRPTFVLPAFICMMQRCFHILNKYHHQSAASWKSPM